MFLVAMGKWFDLFGLRGGAGVRGLTAFSRCSGGRPGQAGERRG